MFSYWLVFGIFAIGSFLAADAPRSRPTVGPILAVCAVAVALWMGLRYETGGDWLSYRVMFAEYSDNDLGYALSSRGGDPAFGMLNWLSYQIGSGIWGVNLVSGALLMWGVVRFAKEQPNPWLVVCVSVPYLIIVVGMGYVRQAVAIGLMLIALQEFGRRRFVGFLIFAVLATAFHKSALVAVPVIVLSEARYKFTVYGFGLVFGGILFASFIDAFLDNLLTNYVEGQMTSSGAGVRVAMNLVPAAIFLLFRKRFASAEQQLKLWSFYSVAALGVGIAYALSPASTAVDRIALYLIPMQLFVFGRLPYAFPGRRGADKILLILVIVYSGAIQYVWLNYAENAHAWIPYRSYLGTE